jgi:predicted ArsR family transcriptional regulator
VSITEENRREAYYEVQQDAPTRRWHIVQVLRFHPDGMTAEDIGAELVTDGIIREYTDNSIRPRLTELAQTGIVEAAGKAKSSRTGRKVTVWKLAKEKPLAGGQTEQEA